MRKLCFLVTLFVAMLVVFQHSSLTVAAEKVQIVVSIRPQIYFVKHIGGNLVNVTSILSEGAFPGVYEPTAIHMKALSSADMYVRIRVPYENAWWEKMLTVNPDICVVDSTEGVDVINNYAQRQYEEEKEKHEHHGRDPHIWLSPKQAKIQAENIYHGLIAVDPENKSAYTTNKETFLKTLDELDNEIQRQLANLSTRKFMIFHPAWSYFARDYNLEQIPIEVEGKEPSAAEMMEFMKIAEKEHITTIFVQPQTSRRTADIIARQIGAGVEILDPLAADWMKNMRHTAKTLAEALSK